MSNESRQEFQELEAKFLASRVAKHAKLLQQARRKLHWSDLSMSLVGLLLLLVGFIWLDSFEPSQKSLAHVIILFLLGFFFASQTWVFATVRRVDALVKLVEEAQEVESVNA